MKILDPYRKVKALLVENGYAQLEKVNILELTENDKRNDICVGYCKCKPVQDKQCSVSNNKILITVDPEYVKIKIRKDEELLEPHVVLPTLLHEFAHCIAKVERIKNDKGEWENHYHEEEFYNCFAELLKVAEELGIYKLTYSSGFKFGMANLKRFDNIYLMNNGVINTGYSELFPNKKTKHIVKFNVQTPKGPKMIFWNKEIVDLYSLIKTKTNIKKKEFTLIDENGNEISRKDITNGCNVWIKQ